MINEMSPRAMARITAVTSLILIVAGIFAQGFVAERLIRFGDAGITAANIVANETLYKSAFTVYLIEMTAQIVMTVLFYLLLKPVSRGGALLSLVLGLTGALVKIIARLFFIVPVYLLTHTSSFSGYSVDQLASLSLTLLRINDEGAALACAFFGPATFLQGWLMMKSTYFPKWLGLLGVVGGALWTSFYWPELGRELFMASALVGIVGTLATIVWMLWRGVDEPRFLERVKISSSSIWS